MTARSQAICSSLPPPTHAPLIRAMVGLPMFRSRSCISMNAPIQRQYWPLVAPMAACSFRSAPVQKARSPAPVTTTTPTRVVPGCLLEGRSQLAQGPEVKGVHDLGPVDGDRGDAGIAASTAYRMRAKSRVAGSTAVGASGSHRRRFIGLARGRSASIVAMNRVTPADAKLRRSRPLSSARIRGERGVEVGAGGEAISAIRWCAAGRPPDARRPHGSTAPRPGRGSGPTIGAWTSR